MDLNEILNCPDCISGSTDECGTCTGGWPRKSGVLSFIDEEYGHATLHSTDTEKIAKKFENESDEQALGFVLDTHGRQIFDEIANVRTETWRMLVPDELTGRCLNLFAGFGKSSRMLAEICDEVYAVDRSLNQLRVLDNFGEGRNVLPIHTDINHLPFTEESFDVVVISSIHRDRLREIIQKAKWYLKDGGTLVIRIDGWTKISGITYLFGLEADTTAIRYNPSTILKSNVASIERAFESAGYVDLDVFSVISTINDRKVWSFNVEQDEIVQWLLQTDQRANLPIRLRLARSAGKVINRSGLLKNFYPGYIVACRKRTESGAPDRSEELLMTGMNRTVLLSLDDENVRRIRKVPNSHAFEHVNQNAIATIRHLANTGIRSSLPSGESNPTKFGLEWREKPVEGIPLNDSVDRNIKGFRSCLTIGFDWLSRLARETKREEISLTPEEVEADLSHPEVSVVNPPDTTEIPMVKTAIHGDFSLPNIFVKNGEISNVIDWEFSDLNEYPVTDAGFFVLQTAEYMFEDFEKGFDEAFLSENQYRKNCKEHIHRYCEQVGIPTRAFIRYLPYSYIRRARIDHENHLTLDIDWPSRVDYIRENQETLDDVFL